MGSGAKYIGEIMDIEAIGYAVRCTNELHQIYAILELGEPDKVSFWSNFVTWQQSTMFSPLDGLKICRARASYGLWMPWEKELENE